MSKSFVFLKFPGACLLGSMILLTSCDDFVLRGGKRGASGSAITNPSRAQLEQMEKVDEAKYGPRVKKRTQKIIRDAETGQVVDPSLIPVEEGRATGELVPDNNNVIKQEIIDTPPAMNMKKKQPKTAPVLEPLTPPAETETPAPATDPRNSRPTLPPPAVEKMVPELMEPAIPSELR